MNSLKRKNQSTHFIHTAHIHVTDMYWTQCHHDITYLCCNSLLDAFTWMKKLYAEDTKLKQKQLQICPILSLQLDIFMLLVSTLHRQP